MALGCKSFLLLNVFYFFISNLNVLTQSQQVPCLFIFGDSQMDNGNNNLLSTMAKVNYKPYGIDYQQGPTGRFTNGRNLADFFSQFLGFKESIPSFAQPTGSQGVNYASGSAGIRDETGKNMGVHISLNGQLQNHGITVARLNGSLAGAFDPTKCLYLVNMGSNDYLNNYLLPKLYPTSSSSTPQQFALSLIQQYAGQLKTLYNYGARKVAVFGVGLLGCVPQELAMNPGHSGPCVDSINNDVLIFNNMLKTLVADLNNDLIGSHFTYIDSVAISLSATAGLGIKFTNVPCCTVSPSTGLCLPNSVPCANRNIYSFWDGFHPTEVVYQAIATSAYNGNIKRLALLV